ncbi:C1 family peptidase [Flavobacterium sp.]|uniref:C1 family peptidase n=1 Tax=Flavobacterium sp. TaxID=239 RepID=UPI0035295E3D
MKKGVLLFLLFFICMVDYSCSEEEENSDGETNSLEFWFGWNGSDDMSTTPSSTNFGFGSGSLPSSVDLVPKFPPIGNQGNYGTCVAWAVAYNAKTALNGISKNLSTSDLYATANQFSPKDLFTAIPDNQKGGNCNGTNFSTAFEILQNRGVATMQTVPYNGLGNCSSSNLQANWNSEASQNKIKYWRKIEGTVQSIKQNLANNIPVVFGAKLADNFMTWNSSNVLSSNTSYNNVGQHAYHAMVVAGYDDNKGANGAFKIINSWGEYWGNNGYCWVDYNFFINEFCTGSNGDKPLFIAANAEGGNDNTPPDETNPNVSGVDLAAWVFADYSNYQNTGVINNRKIEFNVYNIGNQTASANNNWSVYYIYFNAYNANDYGVIFADDFNTSTSYGSYYCDNNYTCTFNINLLPGSNFAGTIFGSSYASRSYNMPPLTGYYYLVVLADAGDSFVELDEMNNLFYTTNQPKYFDYGYSSRSSENNKNNFNFSNTLEATPTNLKRNEHNKIVSKQTPNAYTSEEILDFIKREYNNGELKSKILRHQKELDSAPYNKKK